MRWLLLLWMAISGQAETWTLYSWGNNGRYNPSDAPNATFAFPPAKRNTAFPAFLTTQQSADLTGKAISCIVGVTSTGNPQFIYGGATPWSSWNKCPTPANTRLYFSTSADAYNLSAASQNPNAYWWSQIAKEEISILVGITLILDGNFNPTNWSNATGKSAADLAYTPAFQAAVRNVKQIGVSFGGGCYFDVGVALLPKTGTATFTLGSFTIQ